MTKHSTVVAVAFLFVSLLPAGVGAGEMAGVMMKGGEMMMMEDGKPTGPMEHEMTMTNGCKVMPDGTMKMPDGKTMRMAEGQMMMMDGTMMQGGKGMMGGKGMKMDGMAPMEQTSPALRNDLANMYQEMAECVRAGGASEDCQRKIAKDCPVVAKTGRCPIKEGTGRMMGHRPMAPGGMGPGGMHH